MIDSSSVIVPELFENDGKIHSRLHAKKLDKILGYKVTKIEVKLHQKYRSYDRFNDESNKKQHYKGAQTWIGLHPQVLQTPYCDIYQALLTAKDMNIEHVVDIGAGYGRVGVVLNALAKEAKFTGYEVVKERQAEGNRIFEKLGLKNANIELKNVSDASFELPKAQVYFIYDFSDMEDICEVLLTLAKRTLIYDFCLITKGDRVEKLMKRQFKHVWKKNIYLEYSDLSIYKSIVS